VSGLARVVVNAPGRRVDVAVPELAPIAELLPALLRHAGEGLADQGQAHGGWVLRRADGAPLSVGEGLSQQGVRDGDVLHLVPARERWPELAYDDVVDAIAQSARQHGRAWDAAATRATGLGLAGAVLLAGLVALARAGAAGGPVALGLAVLLVAAGTLASRAYGDVVSGRALAAAALPYAAVGGALLLRVRQPVLGGAHLLVACAAVVLASVVAAVGVGGPARVFMAGTVAGSAGGLGALLALWLPGSGSAAVVLAVLVASVAALPLLAIRLGKLPTPVPVGDGGEQARPERARLYAAVARTDDMLTGMLAGTALAAVGCCLVVAASGGTAGWILAAIGATGLALRSRLFPTVRQRLPLLLGGAAGGLALLARVIAAGRPPGAVLAAGLVAVALALVVSARVYQRRPPGPYLGRAADLLDAACVVSVTPLACGVLGLFGAVRALVS
jgi:type VII secretion integral membrane protein EccD